MSIKRTSLLILISILFSCTNSDDSDTVVQVSNFLKVSDIYLINSFELVMNQGISYDINQLDDDTYVQNLITTITQLSDYDFDEVCHIEYDSNGLVSNYKIGTNQIASWRYDFGGTIQRDDNGNIISINDNPITVTGNSIIFDESNGWASSTGSVHEVNFSGNKLTKTFYRDNSGAEVAESSYTYQYSGNDFIRKQKTSNGFTFYEVSDYHNEDFYLPWIMHHSQERLALEIAFNLRLMGKIPKTMINSQHANQDVEITKIIKDASNRPIFILGRNAESGIDRIAIYTYAD
ncbi:hypothetical protein EZY14_009785 [Kordia sp. TARA_039_SRF]|nr:hypothetical protein EZY14_009785 [Kordia sp. TARA_039_SRF]